MREEQTVRRPEVALHPFRIYDESVDDPGEAIEHVVECEKCVRDDDALGGGVGDIAFVPERHVLEADHRRGADNSRKPRDALGDLGVAFVRHRGRALHAGLERLLDLAHLRAREMTDLRRESVEGGCADRERRQELGVTVARDHLRRDRIGLETQTVDTRSARPLDRSPRRFRPSRKAARRDSPRERFRRGSARGRARTPSRRASTRTSSARHGCRASGRCRPCGGAPRRVARRRRARARCPARSPRRRRGSAAPAPCRRRRRTSARSAPSGPQGRAARRRRRRTRRDRDR